MLARQQQQQQQQSEAKGLLDPQSELGSQLIRSLSRLQLLYIINEGYVTLTQDCLGVEGVGTARCCMAPKRDLPKRAVPELTVAMQKRSTTLGGAFHIELDEGNTEAVDFMDWVAAKYPPASPTTPNEAAEPLIQLAVKDLTYTYKRVQYEGLYARVKSWTEAPSELKQRRDVCYTAAKLWGQYVSESMGAGPALLAAMEQGHHVEKKLKLDSEDASDVDCFEQAIFAHLFGIPHPSAMLSVDYGPERQLFDIVYSMPSDVRGRIYRHLPRKSCSLVNLDSATGLGGGKPINLVPCPSQYPTPVDSTVATGYLARAMNWQETQEELHARRNACFTATDFLCKTLYKLLASWDTSERAFGFPTFRRTMFMRLFVRPQASTAFCIQGGAISQDMISTFQVIPNWDEMAARLVALDCNVVCIVTLTNGAAGASSVCTGGDEPLQLATCPLGFPQS
jgi:hypothetical protein